jgi:hypothetical protein
LPVFRQRTEQSQQANRHGQSVELLHFKPLPSCSAMRSAPFTTAVSLVKPVASRDGQSSRIRQRTSRDPILIRTHPLLPTILPSDDPWSSGSVPAHRLLRVQQELSALLQGDLLTSPRQCVGLTLTGGGAPTYASRPAARRGGSDCFRRRNSRNCSNPFSKGWLL